MIQHMHNRWDNKQETYEEKYVNVYFVASK